MAEDCYPLHIDLTEQPSEVVRERSNDIYVSSLQRDKRDPEYVDRAKLSRLVNTLIERMREMRCETVFLPVVVSVVTRIVTQVGEDPATKIAILESAKISVTRSVSNDIAGSGEIVVGTIK